MTEVAGPAKAADPQADLMLSRGTVLYCRCILTGAFQVLWHKTTMLECFSVAVVSFMCRQQQSRKGDLWLPDRRAGAGGRVGGHRGIH